jgi:hypothetical protein
LPGPGEIVSSGAHIEPLLRGHDCRSMSVAFALWPAACLREHVAEILARLRGGWLPCDGEWPARKAVVFQRWTESGSQR